MKPHIVSALSVARSLALIIALRLVLQAHGAGATAQVPLREGLTIVTAINDARGDYESIKRVTHIDEKSVKLTYSTDLPPAGQDANSVAALLGGDCIAKGEGRDLKKVQRSVVRAARREDLEAAHEYRYYFNVCAVGEELFPGSTAVGVSKSVLQELNGKGQTALSVPAGGLGGTLTNLVGGLLGELGGRANEFGQAGMLSGVLTRVERGPVPFKVLVNDEQVELPAVHVRGQLGDKPSEFWILNDPANPLSLRWSIGESERLQVIKLSYPVSQAAAPSGPASSSRAALSNGSAASAMAARIERDLAKEGRAVVYGIYFDFASDRIKEESNTVLLEIATVLQQNPTWLLTIEGHTDNIGGEAYNLDLSNRRAAAVKHALVTRYRLDGKRLQTGGYGASRPKDTNQSLEGRARNRRVELVKAG